jgi:uncharacterized membrane protein
MLRTTSLLLALGVALVIVGCSGGDTSGAADSSSNSAALTEPTNSEPVAVTGTFESDAKPIIAAKCIGCHSGAAPKGGLDFSTISTNADAAEKAEWIKKMAEEVAEGKMPAKGGAPLTDEEKTKLLAALNAVGG